MYTFASNPRAAVEKLRDYAAGARWLEWHDLELLSGRARELKLDHGVLFGWLGPSRPTKVWWFEHRFAEALLRVKHPTGYNLSGKGLTFYADWVWQGEDSAVVKNRYNSPTRGISLEAALINLDCDAQRNQPRIVDELAESIKATPTTVEQHLKLALSSARRALLEEDIVGRTKEEIDALKIKRGRFVTPNLLKPKK